ncbi:hypothetical protein [Bradyrhizobium sp. CSS354]|uniref:hypothetical protein n=1 Tax=Bradyrhizobium sp. CSS354 TaxID=2699172 RepID=UPI0023AF9407|nr:hypothetical protein [Bradyrhizobium sp. CSS354]MDE5462202.1 hypothetical protein [Bradyrhizobium sp. CSS354]
MANPLTLYIPIKQDQTTQDAAQAARKHFVSTYTPALDHFGKVHYARFVLIPNHAVPGKILAICVMTSFDGPTNPYLTDFWNDPALREVFAGLAKMALADTSITDYTGFENFINENNLSEIGELYQAYKYTVVQIKADVKYPA